MANEPSEVAPGHNKTVKIVVNLNEYEMTGKEISYRQVAKLAYPDDPDSPEIIHLLLDAGTPKSLPLIGKL